MIELLKYELSPFIWNLHHNTLRLLNVESCDEHACLARADLNDVVAAAHALALLVEDDPVLVQDACLPVDDGAGLGELLLVVGVLWTRR